MDMCSLEEDEVSKMFITQESKEHMEIEPNDEDSGEELFLGVDPFDFCMPSKSLISMDIPHYLDILGDNTVFEEQKSV